MKTLCNTYSINGNAITMSGVNVPTSQILLIADATQGSILYQIGGTPPSSYTQGTNSILTLAGSPTITNSDLLAIYYDNGINTYNPPTVVGLSGVLPSGSNYIGYTNPDLSGGTGVIINANTGSYVVNTTNYSTLGFQSVPTNVSAGTINIEGSIDGSTWLATSYVSLTNGASAASYAATSNPTVGQINTSAIKAIRFRANGLTGTTPFQVAFVVNQSSTTSNVMLDNSLPVGYNLIGKIQPTDPSGNLITIKPALTAAGAGDTAEVVALSPNSSLPPGNNNIGITNYPTGNISFSGVTINTGTAIVFPASTAIKMFAFQNLSTGTVYISNQNPALSGNSMNYAPGQGYEFPVVPQNALYASATINSAAGVIWYA